MVIDKEKEMETRFVRRKVLGRGLEQCLVMAESKN